MAITVSGFNVSEAAKYVSKAAQSNNDSSAVGPVAWEVNKNKLITQMGSIQAVGLKAGTDIYKNRSPLDADTHITNIATSLARDYGVTDITDIGVRDVKRDGYAVGDQESYNYIPEHTVPEFYNKKTGQVIPSYRFASEGKGDGYSDYNLEAIKQADGTSIVIPIQSYSKSGLGAVQEAIAPVLPILAVALMATGAGALVGKALMGGAVTASAATAVGSAAINLGAQALAGNIKNASDVLQAVAPSAVTFGLSEIADVYKAVDTAKQALAYNALAAADKLEDIGTISSSIKALTDAGVVLEKLTGISGTVADVLGNAVKGGVSASLSDQDVTTGTAFGVLEGLKATKVGLREPADVTEANPFKSLFEITPTTLTSAPENTDALAKALGVDTTGLDMGDVIPTDNMLTAQTGGVFKPIVTSTSVVDFTNEDYFSGLSEDKPFKSDISTQTDELFEPFSKEAFMPGKYGTTTTTPAFTSTTQEGMLGDVGSGVSNIMGNTTLGDVTDLGATNTYGGMLGEVGSGASNIMGNKSINAATLDVTGVNKGLGGTLGTSQLNETTSNILGASSSKPTISGENIVKIGASMVVAADAGSALTDSGTTTTTTSTPSLKATYANAPIKGFRMQKMQNEGGLTTYIPYINQTSLLPVPTGYKAI